MTRGKPRAGARRLGAYIVGNLTDELNHRLDEGLRLQRAWESAVPEPLASHAHPVRYAAGLLFVHVNTPAWASRLRHQQTSLTEALRRIPALRGMTDLRMKVVPPGSADFPSPAPRPRTRLTEKAARVIERAAADITDPTLRAALERLAQRGDTPSTKRKA